VNALRFPMDADTREEAVGYFEARATQMITDGAKIVAMEPLVHGIEEWGLQCLFRGLDCKTYQSVYVYRSHRGRRHLSEHVKRDRRPFVTVDACGVAKWFVAHNVDYKLVGLHTTLPEYQAIEAHYGDRRARRSGVFLMNHIDEGIAVLDSLRISDFATRAFCLHPLFQLDSDLSTSYWKLGEMTDSPRVLVLAMEYRNIANAYLSHRHIESASEIALSPIEEVNHMLRADKIQNYKDFITHHRGTHPRSAELDRYFRLWLERLDVSLDIFDEWRTRLTVSAP
jgi:hypothetical protein